MRIKFAESFAVLTSLSRNKMLPVNLPLSPCFFSKNSKQHTPEEQSYCRFQSSAQCFFTNTCGCYTHTTGGTWHKANAREQGSPQNSQRQHTPPHTQKNTNATTHTLNCAAECAERKKGDHNFLWWNLNGYMKLPSVPLSVPARKTQSFSKSHSNLKTWLVE